MKERLLVLAKAMPEVSQKYENLVCAAGITDKGEWRRIYPIPFELFCKENKFMKKQWIEYELESDEPSDHRSESRKIKFETIKLLDHEKFDKIETLLNPKVTTIEKLSEKSHTEISLGVIKPKIIDLQSIDNEKYEKLLTKHKQRDLFGKIATLEPPEYKYQIIFKDDSDGTKHEILCEDWELGMLYLKCKKYLDLGKYKSIDDVHNKVRQKILEDIQRKEHVYFIVGTHFRFGTYIVIGIIYPKKEDLKEQGQQKLI